MLIQFKYSHSNIAIGKKNPRIIFGVSKKRVNVASVLCKYDIIPLNI